MEKFTNEEFKEFCEKLQKELEIIEKIANGETEQIDDLNDEELKKMIKLELKNESNYQEIDNESIYQEMEKKMINILSIDKMTDEQFKNFLENDLFLQVFDDWNIPCKEEYEKLIDNKKFENDCQYWIKEFVDCIEK